jgi:tetratricopeptide (TPR) repeat protein
MATTLPETAPLIKAALEAEPQLLHKSCFSMSARLQRLVYDPFKAVTAQPSFANSYLSEPYLIIIDGLDECDDKEDVQELIAATLKFFDQNPSVPLRILITSRVEQHIHSHLAPNRGVRLKDLGDHCTRNDIKMFVRMVFDAETQANPVIQAHVRQNGSWPSRADFKRLVDHIDGSFIFASTLFKFIFQVNSSTNDKSTPLDRLPLALKLDPGLDGLYSQTLARSEHLPHFTDIIPTLAFLAKPLPISGIAELLDIQASAVAHVLVDLQGIIHVPGTDDSPVTFYHTSLRDFLTTESRSGRFFAHPSFHARLFIRCLNSELGARRQMPKVRIDRRKQTAAVQYSLEYRETAHWCRGHSTFTCKDVEALVPLQLEMIELLPDADRAAGFHTLGIELRSLSSHDRSTLTIEEAVSAHREALSLRPYPHPERLSSLSELGYALDLLFEHSRCVSHVEEAISMHREALELCPRLHSDRPSSLNNIGYTLLLLFEHNQRVSHVEEAISMHREALSLRPHPHPLRPLSLSNLGCALRLLFEHNQCAGHIEEAISVHREALSLRPHPHPSRSGSLTNLGNAIHSLFKDNTCTSHIEEAISLHREALSLCPRPRPVRLRVLHNLGLALHSLFAHNRCVSHLQEAISVHREALGLRPHQHRHSSLQDLSAALYDRFEEREFIGDLDEAISLRQEALRVPHPSRPTTLSALAHYLRTRYRRNHSIDDLEEAISLSRELASRHHPEGHEHRDRTLSQLQSLLQLRLKATINRDNLDGIEKRTQSQQRRFVCTASDYCPLVSVLILPFPVARSEYVHEVLFHESIRKPAYFHLILSVTLNMARGFVLAIPSNPIDESVFASVCFLPMYLLLSYYFPSFLAT